MTRRLLNRLYAILPWGIIALGALHMAATSRLYSSLSPAALWFFNGGIVLVFAGVLNLVNRHYGAAAPGLRWFARTSNVVTLCFTLVSGIVGGASLMTLVIVLSLIGGATLLSFLPAPKPV